MSGIGETPWLGSGPGQTTAEVESFDAFGDYADGVRAVTHRVGLRLGVDHLSMAFADGEALSWPLAELRALRDQADAEGIVLTPGHGTTARLVIADAALAARIRLAAPALLERPPVDNWPGIIRWALGAVASVALIVFVLVPIMANQLATYLPPEGERALGDATFGQIRNGLSKTELPIGLCEESAGLEALEAMRVRLNADKDLPYPVNIAVLDHDLVNAFALPGGRIVVFRGLIDEAENPDEVAAILAHELGHVVNRDPTRDALRSAGSIGVLGLLFGDFAGGTMVLMLTNSLINAQYSQSAETRADTYSHQIMAEAGLDPNALGTMFARLREKHGDAEGIAAHFASHPQMAARIEAAAEAGDGFVAGEPVLSDAQWNALQSICGGPPVDAVDLEETERSLSGEN